MKGMVKGYSKGVHRHLLLQATVVFAKRSVLDPCLSFSDRIYFLFYVKFF